MTDHFYEAEILRLRALLDKERRAARTDGLTSLDNRYSFEQNVAWIEQGEDTALVVFFDAANLHYANKVLGYSAADNLLRRIADNLRDYDNAFRIGGDEFAILMTWDSSIPMRDVISAGTAIASRVMREIGEYRLSDQATFFLAAGVAAGRGEDIHAVIEEASKAMAKAKELRKTSLGDAPDMR